MFIFVAILLERAYIHIIFAQILCRTTTSNRDLSSKTKLILELRYRRRLLNNEFEAVVGLAEILTVSALSLLPKFSADFQLKDDSIKKI